MATSTKESKGKRNKDGDKKSAKKAEEVSQPIEEEPQNITEVEEIVEEEITEIESVKEEEATPPPVDLHDGPILTDVIIERFSF